MPYQSTLQWSGKELLRPPVLRPKRGGRIEPRNLVKRSACVLCNAYRVHYCAPTGEHVTRHRRLEPSVGLFSFLCGLRPDASRRLNDSVCVSRSRRGTVGYDVGPLDSADDYNNNNN
ncbi:hypothetical protein LSAT2_023016 [Lamellibrachia satsuma]|nr:hypothetical protein LSAT2_023016 [Lamellibrachia satsuma]